MSDFLRQNDTAKPGRLPDASAVDSLSAVRRQYARAREYCGYSLDDIINHRAAKQTLKDIWLLGCMVRKPWKSAELPPGNAFRTTTAVSMKSMR